MIKRHKFNREIERELIIVENKLEKFNQRVKEQLRKKKFVNLASFKEIGLRLSTYALLENAPKELIYRGLITYLEAGLRHFQLEFTSKPILKIKLGKEEFETKSSDKRDKVSLLDWWKLLNIAMIIRHKGFKEELLTIFEKCSLESNDPFWKLSMEMIICCRKKNGL